MLLVEGCFGLAGESAAAGMRPRRISLVPPPTTYMIDRRRHFLSASRRAPGTDGRAHDRVGSEDVEHRLTIASLRESEPSAIWDSASS